ncbi:hypothetical protein IWQ56_001949, partial [Coemansia nantahalensis]
MAAESSAAAAPYVVRAQLPELTPEFLARYYPRGVGVVHVELLHRHGERTPIAHRVPELMPKNWNFCALGNQLQKDFLAAVGLHVSGAATVAGERREQDGKRRRQIFALDSSRDGASVLGANGATAQHADDRSRRTSATCDYGQLTDLGRQSMTGLGAHVRALYVDALGFLPPTLAPGRIADVLRLRATMYTRTFESLQHALGGLYPHLPVGAPVFRVAVRPPERDNMFPDFGCENMSRMFAQLNAMATKRHAPELAQLREDIGKIPALQSFCETDLKTGGGRMAISLMDVLGTMRAHGLPLPDAINDAFLARLERLAAVEFLASGWHSVALTRMQLGRLVNELAENVAHAVEADRGNARDTQPRLGIRSGHDTSLAGLLAMFGHDASQPTGQMPADFVWPPFASSIRVELLKDTTTPSPAIQPAWEHEQADHADNRAQIPPDRRARPVGVADSLYRWAPGVGPSAQAHPRATHGYYVRVWYNDRALRLPTCRDPGAHHAGLGPSACTLDGFFKQIARFAASDDEARRECQ